MLPSLILFCFILSIYMILYLLSLTLLGFDPIFEKLLFKVGGELLRRLSWNNCYFSFILYWVYWVLDKILGFNTSPMVPAGNAENGQIIFQAPSPCGPVEYFEIPSTPSNDTTEEPLGEIPPQSHSQIESVVRPNFSHENSLHQRILLLEKDNSIFLLDKPKGEYWIDVQNNLRGQSNQKNYLTQLEVESRDLQIRQLRHECTKALLQILHAGYPDRMRAGGGPDTEMLLLFFDETREGIDKKHMIPPHIKILPGGGFLYVMKYCNVEGADHEEIAYLTKIRKDLSAEGQYSHSFESFLNHLGES